MSFIKELKQRNVFRVGIAYAIVAWLLLQLADIVLDNIDAPVWVFQTILLLLVIGFPLALVFAWAFELTPEGLKKEKDVDRSASVTPVTGRKLDFFIIAALALALVFVVIEYVLPPTADVSENLRSIAVLPFDNRSAEEEDAAFLADGVHDELLTRLSKIHDLQVISRTSVMQYRDNTTRNMRQIGTELGVGSIVEGGVQRAGDTVRINVQLIDAQTDEHLWAETYEEALSATNLFEIQTKISTAIANALRATLSPDEQQRIAKIPTENMEALEAYFVGKQFAAQRSPEALVNAIRNFKRAIELDSDFAGAYARLAEARGQLATISQLVDVTQERAEAAAAAQKAMDIDPDLPDALAVLGSRELRFNFDWQSAEQLFSRALLIEPANNIALHWYSHLRTGQGKHQEALEMAKRVVAADPFSPQMQNHLFVTYAAARQWDEAFSLGEELLRQDGNHNLMQLIWLGQLQARRAEDAAAMLKTWAEATDRSVEAAQELGSAFIHYQQTGETVVLPHDLLERLRLQDESRVYAAVGDKEKTITALQESHARLIDATVLLNMKINPSYDFIRDDPRFVELLEQIGLAD